MPVVAAIPAVFAAIGGTAGAVAAGSTVAGSLIANSGAKKAASTQSDAAKYAADLQSDAAGEALDFQKQQWQTAQENTAPWLTAGKAGLGALTYGMGLGTLTPSTQAAAADPNAALRTTLTEEAARIQQRLQSTSSPIAQAVYQGKLNTIQRQLEGMPEAPTSPSTTWTLSQAADGSYGMPVEKGELLKSFSMADYEADPGYQFRISEGQKAIDRSAAARGGALSGGTIRAGERYASDLASQEYGNAYNRFNNDQANKYNRLAALSGVGQTAGGALTAAGQSFANNSGNILTNAAANVGDLQTQAANARASGYVSSGNTWGNAVSGIGNNILQTFLQNQAQNQALNHAIGQTAPVGGLSPWDYDTITNALPAL
jgi:hypothetical protein